jgi:hypothetical protein
MLRLFSRFRSGTRHGLSVLSSRVRGSARFPFGASMAVLAMAAAAIWGAATLAQQPPPLNRQQAWNKVRDAMNKGLPKTAIEELKPIIAAAMREKRYAEAVKAIGQTIAFEGMIEGGKAEEKVTRMRAEIAKAPAEMKPIMEAILANWFWQY